MSSSGTPGAGGGEERGEELSEEQQAQLDEAAEQVAAVRARLAAAPAELVVTNHVMGLYELAAVHLDHDPPNVAAARLAIDALGGVLDACAGRLGEAEPTLVGARGQIQLAFVAVSRRAGGGASAAAEPGGAGTPGGGDRPQGDRAQDEPAGGEAPRPPGEAGGEAGT